MSKLYRSTKLQSAFSIKIRALVNDKPSIFPLRDVVLAFIKQRLKEIEKKARILFLINQKELFNLKFRQFIIDNNRELSNIFSDEKMNVTEDEKKNVLEKRFASDIESFKNFLSLMEGEKRNSEELKQVVLSRILDTQFNFRQFLAEKRKRLEDDILSLQERNKNLKMIFTDEDRRKEELIIELEKLRNYYHKDYRRTVVSSEKHLIDERELTPNVKRLVILSRKEDKKDELINSYISIYDIGYIEGTAIPSRGKELKIRGTNPSFIKMSRRDNL